MGKENATTSRIIDLQIKSTWYKTERNRKKEKNNHSWSKHFLKPNPAQYDSSIGQWAILHLEIIAEYRLYSPFEIKSKPINFLVKWQIFIKPEWLELRKYHKNLKYGRTAQDGTGVTNINIAARETVGCVWGWERYVTDSYQFWPDYLSYWAIKLELRHRTPK